MFINIQLFAHKKGGGSRGTKFHDGNNVGKGGDDTLYALIDGVVKFERKGKDKKQVSVYAKAE